MPKIGDTIFDTPSAENLFFLTARAQQLAIAAAHELNATAHQTDRPIAKIMRLPGAIGDSLLTKQRLGYAAIAAAFTVRVERADCGTQAFAPLLG